MRVSDASITQRFLAEFGARRSDMDRLLRQLADGKRVRVASDDPVAAQESMITRSRAIRIQGLDRSAGAARTDLDSIDFAIGEVFELVTKARDLGSQGVTTGDAGSNAIRATDVRAIRDTILSLANTYQRDRYLFGGSATDAVPFDAAGTYQGNGTPVQAPIDVDISVGVTVSGADVFQGNGVDVFQLLDDLANALDANDTAAVTALLPDFENALDSIGLSRTDVGNRLARIDSAREKHADELVRLGTRISELEDIPLEEIAAGLATTEAKIAGLSATLNRIVGRSLFDVIG